MLLFLCVLVGLFGVSLLTWGASRRATTLERGSYGKPPADWPDIPVEALGLFRRSGLINQPCARSAVPVRVTSFEAAQQQVLAYVRPTGSDPPHIALRLSDGGSDWTDVLIDGALVVQVPTATLVARIG